MATKLRETVPDGTAAPRGSLALVLNGKAGALLADGQGGATLPDLARAAGFHLVEFTEGPLRQRLTQARDSGANLVAVAGGDGTVACAADVLAGTDVKLGIVPGGTMNLLAKDLGIPPADPEAALRILTEGHCRAIDMGRLEGHAFLCAAMLGTPARIGHHREDGRRRGNGVAGWLHVGRAAIRALLRHRPLRLGLTVDGVHHRVRTASLTITVNALDEASPRPFARARLDGGAFCLYIVQRQSALGLLRLLASALRNRIGRDPGVTVLRGRSIRIDSATPALRVLIDGEEHLLPTPLHAEIEAGALRVFAPAA